ncbi:MAG TPA: hypothetical protein VF008_20840 [Niastella sp.]
MKRGISIALQAAGMLLACVATSLNHPVIARESTIQWRDTAYYFNEKGDTIFCDTKAASPGNFVIRTCKTREEIFPDWYGGDSTKSSGNYQPAEVHGIPVSKAKRVGRLIRRGKLSNRLVGKNIVAILDKNTIREMFDAIHDSGSGTDSSTDFYEYGGVIKTDSSLTFQIGEWSDVCKGGAAVDIDSIWIGIGCYHSHPSGENDCVNNKGQKTRYAFVQGPSSEDQNAVKKNTINYVFGMNKNSLLIYIYDSSGVKATLPFSFLPSQPVNK